MLVANENTWCYIGCMSSQTGGPKSFRLSSRTLELLERRADELRESRNALADRLLGEALRIEHHPLIAFRQNADGVRRPGLAGTRLYVWQVIECLRGERETVESVADAYDIDARLVRAAVQYYADFADEVDRDRDEAAETARLEHERHLRADALLG